METKQERRARQDAEQAAIDLRAAAQIESAKKNGCRLTESQALVLAAVRGSLTDGVRGIIAQRMLDLDASPDGRSLLRRRIVIRRTINGDVYYMVAP